MANAFGIRILYARKASAKRWLLAEGKPSEGGEGSEFDRSADPSPGSCSLSLRAQSYATQLSNPCRILSSGSWRPMKMIRLSRFSSGAQAR
jgi:hypothetical protein